MRFYITEFLKSPAGTPEKSCNDDMILFMFHMNAAIK